MSDHRCSHCNAALPGEGIAGGLCPRCLLELGLPGSEGGGESTATRAQPGQTDPTYIGAYRILETLGQGGMGIVYLAEQSEPIRRRVALKVVKPGMDTREVLARFAAERQALALMSHPNVAKVFDAGVTEQGRPYFVMEYVPGIRITEYCDLRCLSVKERLKLFATVCDAIQHAHQKGVIHRDIKPSNVLVSSEDGNAVPKVIDFGLAKATGAALTERTLFTQQGVAIGTPEYMSPEQAGPTALDVDARTDIYSLGVLLYELLVGALPFDPATLRRAAVVEMLRIIQEEEPPTPTSKLGSLRDTAPEVARRRNTDVRSLGRQLRGELDWITMRAMEKNPNRRYPSASELAAEVRRHLADEPVVAGPPSPLYRFRKLVSRHRGVFAAAVASFALLLAGVVVISSLYFRSEVARRRAEAEAFRNALDAESLQAALLGDNRRYQKLSHEAMKLHRSLLGKDSARLSLYAVNRLTLLEMIRDGFLSPSLDYDERSELKHEAQDLVNRALETREPDAVKAAVLLTELLEPEEAQAMARRVLALTNGNLSRADEMTLEKLERLVQRLQMQAIDPLAAADDEAFEAVYRESLNRRGKVLSPQAMSLVETRRSLAAVLERKGGRLLRAGDTAAAAVFREALSILEQTGLKESERAAKVRSELGASLTALARYSEAEPLLQKAIEALETKRGTNNASTQEALNRLANLYEAWNRPEAAARTRTHLPEIFAERASDLGALHFDPTAMHRDGGYSALLDGQSVWVFGETETSSLPKAGSSVRQATLAWTDNLDARKGLATLNGLKDRTGLSSEVLPLTSEEAAFNAAHAGVNCTEPCDAGWMLTPGAVIADADRDRLLVFYRRVLRQKPRPDARAGSSLGIWTRGRLACDRPTVRPGTNEPTLLFGPDEPVWGSAAVVVAGQIYAYACESRDLVTACRLARVPLAEALDRSAWRFFAAAGRWSSEWADAQLVLKGGMTGTLSVHWNPFLRKFLAISSRVLDARVGMRIADQPEGPWSDAEIEVDTLHSEPGWFWTNQGLGHSELAGESGRTEYLTYRRNVGMRSQIRLIEVRFCRK